MIDRYLEELERRLDTDVEADLVRQWADFTQGRFGGQVFSPRRRSALAPAIDWPKVRINDALDDLDALVLQQFGECSAAVAAGSGAVLCVRANYGTGILPTVFGAPLYVMDTELDTLPTSTPLATTHDDIRRLVDRGVPDLDTGLGARVFETGERLATLLKDYPKMRRFVHIYHPDLQGPIDAAELLCGSSIFLSLVDAPELVHQLLDLVTETYIRFMRRWNAVAPPPDDYGVHWGMMHGGHIMIREDSAMNLSPAMYGEFARPYDQRLLDELGGGAIHYCGRGHHFVPLAAGMNGLHAVNLSQPHLNDMEVVYRNTVDRGLKLLAIGRGAVRQAVDAGRDLHGCMHCPDW